MKVSLVIPAYNEAAVIAGAIRDAEGFLADSFDDFELIVVNDGSTDGTADIAERVAKLPSTRVVGYEKNRGKGCAVRTGMLAASGDLVFFTDADLAYGLEPLRSAAAAFSDTGADAVIGTRRHGRGAYGGYPALRVAASKCFSALTGAVSGVRYDTQCGFKGFTADTVRRVFPLCTVDGFAFDFEVMLIFDRLGLHAEEMPVEIVNHRASTVHVFRDSLRMLRDVIRIRRSMGKE